MTFLFTSYETLSNHSWGNSDIHMLDISWVLKHWESVSWQLYLPHLHMDVEVYVYICISKKSTWFMRWLFLEERLNRLISLNFKCRLTSRPDALALDSLDFVKIGRSWRYGFHSLSPETWDFDIYTCINLQIALSVFREVGARRAVTLDFYRKLDWWICFYVIFVFYADRVWFSLLFCRVVSELAVLDH